MSDVSNKTIALLVILAIAISIAGMIISQKGVVYLTGAQSTDTGTASFEISSVESINVSYNIDWGAGKVDAGHSSATLYSNNASVENGNWSLVEDATHGRAFIIENDGTVNISVDVKTNVTSSDLIGGGADMPEFKFWAREHEASSCAGGILNGSSYGYFLNGSNVTAGETANAYSRICDNLNVDQSKNALNISIKLVIPSDASPGARSATVTFQGTGLYS